MIDDPAVQWLTAARTLTELVGEDAMRWRRLSAQWLLAALATAMLAGAPLLVLSDRTSGAAGNWYAVGAGIAYVVAVTLVVPSVRALRRAGQAASEHLEPHLGHPVRPATFNSLEGWRTHLLREHDDALCGRKRPFISVRINRPL